MTALMQNLSEQKKIHDGVNDVRQRLISSSLNDTRRRVIASFSQKLEFQKCLSSALKIRQLGTGNWICENEKVRLWMSENQARLYLRGIPGAGKSILVATIIEEILGNLQQEPAGSGLAYWFCDYTDPATQDCSNILASLASQFAAQDKSCFSLAQTLYQEHHPSSGAVTSYTVDEVQRCLLDMMKTFDHAYIVIDGLDECVADRASLLEVLHGLNDYENDNVKTLFAAREEYDIQRALHDYEKLPIEANSHDLRLYVDSEMVRRSKNGTLRIRDSNLQEEIRERLVRGAKGM